MQTVLSEGVVLSLTAIVASLLIGELHRTGTVLATHPQWLGLVVIVLRSAAFGMFVSALISVLAVCIVATTAPRLDRDVMSPLIFMTGGMALFVVMRCFYTPLNMLADFDRKITQRERARATIASVVPEYMIYVALLAYLARLTYLTVKGGRKLPPP